MHQLTDTTNPIGHGAGRVINTKRKSDLLQSLLVAWIELNSGADA